MNEAMNEKSQESLKENKVKDILDEISKFDWDWIFEREWLRTKK
ncbi:MAG: hypothetical protein ACFE8L_03465 [Candidatus Hodarchaeota archaeon]